MEEQLEIKKDSIIGDILKLAPQKVMEVFFRYGLYCVGCPIAAGETIEQAAQTHGLNVDELIKELNDNLKKAK